MHEIEAKTLLAHVPQPDTWFGLRYNLNLYRGCAFGCIYCDSRSACYGIERFADVGVKTNAIALLRDELARKRIVGTIGTGSMSDPYGPPERRYGLTGQAPAPGAGEFTLPGDGIFTSLASDASTTIGYRYAPTDHGADSEAIGPIDSNDSAGVADADAPVTLQGIGVGPVFDSSITPDTTIHVADVNLASDESGMIDLIVSNITLDDNGGNDDLTTLTLVDYTITGADADKFSLTTPLGTILKGDDLTLTIEFDPMSTAGDFDAVLTLFTDEDAPLGGDGNVYQWSLTGTSRVPAPAGIWIGLIGLAGMMRRRGRV